MAIKNGKDVCQKLVPNYPKPQMLTGIEYQITNHAPNHNIRSQLQGMYKQRVRSVPEVIARTICLNNSVDKL